MDKAPLVVAVDISANAGKKSVDDVHKEIDTLMLSIFECVRGHETTTDTAFSLEERQIMAAAKSQAVINAYKVTVQAIDDLVGMGKTKEQQEQEIRELSEQCRAVRERVTQHEAQLVSRRDEIDRRLQVLLNDGELGLVSASEAAAESS